MSDLKVGDVIDVVARSKKCTCLDCVFTNTSNCLFSECLFGNRLILKLSTVPKQGDIVWAKGNVDVWVRGKFVALYKTQYIIEIARGHFNSFKTLSTTDPNALKYTLTLREARYAAVDGYKVTGERDDQGFYYTFDAGFGFRLYNSKNELVRAINNLSETQMYAIVED